MARWATTLCRAGLLAAAAALLPTGVAQAQTAELVDHSAFRVCADPANMPFSDDRGDGFENKLADLLAGKLKVPVLYTWFPQATGFIRHTLRAHRCDVVMGYAQGDELVQNTNAYYRSAYVLLYRTGSDLAGVDRIGDPRLRGHRIGVVAGTPPATILAYNGMLQMVKPFPLVVDRRYDSPAEKMVEEIAKGTLDAGLLWGPMGGYYAKRSKTPITVVPLLKEKRGPRMVYRITLGIRPREPNWKHQLNDLIAAHQDEINAILLDYGVPLLDESGKLITR